MEFFAIGVSHKDTPIDIRGRFAFGDDLAASLLERLKSRSLISEALYLTTCNRAELYAVSDTAPAPVCDVRETLLSCASLEQSIAEGLMYIKTGPDAVSHLFRVASSLDSMVVGETQITSQLKEAYFQAKKSRTTGPFINRTILRALHVAKKVRRETDVAKGSVSIASVAVNLIEETFKDLSKLTVLVVGAGEMGALLARQLKKCGVSKMIVANRTFERAQLIAEHSGGRAIRWEDLHIGISQADVVVASTGAQKPVIDADIMRRAKICRPVVMIDLGSPRDIAEEAAKLGQVKLINIDDLRKAADENAKRRINEASKAEKLIEDETRQFISEISDQKIISTVAKLNQKIEDIRRHEVEKTVAMLIEDTNHRDKIVDLGARSIVSKLLHDPVSELKNTDRCELERILLSECLSTLFHLEE